MALTKGNPTAINPTVNATTYSLSHTQITGSDGFLFVSLAVKNGVDVTGVTYNGTSMTLYSAKEFSSISIKYYQFTLDSPATGSNTLQISFSANPASTIGIYIQSFTGCEGVASNSNYLLEAAPNSESLFDLPTGCYVYTAGISTFAVLDITIDGTSYSPATWLHDFNVNGKVFAGKISDTTVSSGTVTTSVNTGAPSFSVVNATIAFEPAAAAPTATSRAVSIT
jgi:hypothetical protein